MRYLRIAVVMLEPPRPTRYIGAVMARRRRPQPLAQALVAAMEATVRTEQVVATLTA